MATRKNPFAGIKKGGFHATLHKPKDSPITAADIAKGKAMGGKAAKQATLAENFKKMNHSGATQTSKKKPSLSSTATASTSARTKPSPTTKKKKPLTPTQKEAARKADSKRYAKNPAKRIAAEKAYQKKEKAQHPEIFKARAKVNNAKRDGKLNVPPGTDWHHESYNSKKPKGGPMPRSQHRRLPNPKKPRTT